MQTSDEYLLMIDRHLTTSPLFFKFFSQFLDFLLVELQFFLLFSRKYLRGRSKRPFWTYFRTGWWGFWKRRFVKGCALGCAYLSRGKHFRLSTQRRLWNASERRFRRAVIFLRKLCCNLGDLRCLSLVSSLRSARSFKCFSLLDRSKFIYLFCWCVLHILTLQ